MTLKEEIYQAVHDYVKQRIKELSEQEQYNYENKIDSLHARLIELLKVQQVMYKMFTDYNEKLAQR